jgi:hypothetical protein
MATIDKDKIAKWLAVPWRAARLAKMYNALCPTCKEKCIKTKGELAYNDYCDVCKPMAKKRLQKILKGKCVIE